MERLAPSRDYWRASVNIALYLLVQQDVAVGFSEGHCSTVLGGSDVNTEEKNSATAGRTAM